jgi:cytochrome c peroxidase
MGETDRLEDAYRFRTPALRNVALTGPYGHNGAYATLEGIIRHHLDPLGSLANWDPAQVILPKAEWLEGIDFVVLEDRLERKRLKSHLDIQPLDLNGDEVADLVTFMHALTGKESIWGTLGRPDRVPSGLPVD